MLNLSLLRFIKGRKFPAQQKYELAAQDLEQALPYAYRSRESITMLHFDAISRNLFIVCSWRQAALAKKFFVDEVDQAVRSYGVLEGDGSYVKVDIPGLFMIRGDVLRRSGQIEEARKVWELYGRIFPRSLHVGKEILSFSEARLALAEHDINGSCQHGLDALEIARATDSRSGETKVYRLYWDIYKAEPSHPRIKRLGIPLAFSKTNRDNAMKQTTDVFVIGGGIIGCSLAYYLRKRGVNVMVVDQGEVGKQASGAASGLLAPIKPFTKKN